MFKWLNVKKQHVPRASLSTIQLYIYASGWYDLWPYVWPDHKASPPKLMPCTFFSMWLTFVSRFFEILSLTLTLKWDIRSSHRLNVVNICGRGLLTSIHVSAWKSIKLVIVPVCEWFFSINMILWTFFQLCSYQLFFLYMFSSNVTIWIYLYCK